MQLRFDIDPLSCILALADVLEDFARPTAVFRNDARSVDLSYEDGCDSVELALDWARPGREMRITYKFRDARHYAAKLNWMPKEHREYFGRPNGYLDLGAIGIQGVDMAATLAP